MKQTVIDDCLKKVGSRFELVKLITMRAKQLNKGLKPLTETHGEKNILVSMQEIAEGKVFIVDKEQSEDDE